MLTSVCLHTYISDLENEWICEQVDEQWAKVQTIKKEQTERQQVVEKKFTEQIQSLKEINQ